MMTNANVYNNGTAGFKKSKASQTASKVLIYFVLILYAVIIIFPFSIIILTSFKTMADARSMTFEWIPANGFTLEGYIEAFEFRANPDSSLPTLVRSFINTVLYIIPPTIIGLFTSSMAAYAFAKLKFRAKNVMYSILLATMMIPGTITIAPQFAIYDAIQWVDTPLPLMIPGMFGAAACVFFMRQFFSGIPDSLVEAAKLDGESYIGIFFRIMVPLSVPALIAQGLLGFIGGYNDYFNPLIYLQSSEIQTLQVALRTFSTVYVQKPNIVMAGTVIALVPMLIIYFFAQDYFIDGIAASGLKS
ncbi:MAG: carbohydrate ABC transporter permease [Candidatus Borkfalkiaceae bacterium]|nr:carbohydrate ABC transporter permease [Christensenellaceae bacterium]